MKLFHRELDIDRMYLRYIVPNAIINSYLYILLIPSNGEGGKQARIESFSFATVPAH